MILAIVSDLFFQAKIEAISKIKKVECIFAWEGVSIQKISSNSNLKMIIIDSSISEVDVCELISNFKKNTRTRKIPIVVYGSHVRFDLLHDAQDCGADVILVKSVFEKKISELIQSTCDNN